MAFQYIISFPQTLPSVKPSAVALVVQVKKVGKGGIILGRMKIYQ